MVLREAGKWMKLSHWSWKSLKGAFPAKYLKNAAETWPSFTLRCAVLSVLLEHFFLS
jgi:hypothetical protein